MVEKATFADKSLKVVELFVLSEGGWQWPY